MRETRGYIERVKRVSRGHQRLELAVDASVSRLLAGQALLVRPIEKDYATPSWDPYLRELWFPVEIQASSILLVEQPAQVQHLPGQLLSLIGPIGQPFRFRRKLRSVLLIVYDSEPAPLLLMLPALLANQVAVTLILMGTARGYESGHLPAEIEIIRAEDDLTWQDMVMTLGWADQVFALVGRGDERAQFSQIMRLVRRRRNDLPPNYLFGVFQKQLPCGVGACHACVLQTRAGAKLQCVDGPAFDLTTVSLD